MKIVFKHSQSSLEIIINYLSYLLWFLLPITASTSIAINLNSLFFQNLIISCLFLFSVLYIVKIQRSNKVWIENDNFIFDSENVRIGLQQEINLFDVNKVVYKTGLIVKGRKLEEITFVGDKNLSLNVSYWKQKEIDLMLDFILKNYAHIKLEIEK